MLVDFDEDRPIATFEDAEKMSVDQSGGGDEVEEQATTFPSTDTSLGPTLILEMFDDCVAQLKQRNFEVVPQELGWSKWL